MIRFNWIVIFTCFCVLSLIASMSTAYAIGSIMVKNDVPASNVSDIIAFLLNISGILEIFLAIYIVIGITFGFIEHNNYKPIN